MTKKRDDACRWFLCFVGDECTGTSCYACRGIEAVLAKMEVAEDAIATPIRAWARSCGVGDVFRSGAWYAVRCHGKPVLTELAEQTVYDRVVKALPE